MSQHSQRNVPALPNLCSKTVNKKSVVLFSDTVSTLVKDYIESLDDFFIALRKIVLPIPRELFEQGNSLNLKCQKESIPKELLFLTKALVDGFNHDEVNFSQESLRAAEIIVSNATKRTNEKRPKTSLSKMSGNTITYLQQFEDIFYLSLKEYN